MPTYQFHADCSKAAVLETRVPEVGGAPTSTLIGIDPSVAPTSDGPNASQQTKHTLPPTQMGGSSSGLVTTVLHVTPVVPSGTATLLIRVSQGGVAMDGYVTDDSGLKTATVKDGAGWITAATAVPIGNQVALPISFDC